MNYTFFLWYIETYFFQSIKKPQKFMYIYHHRIMLESYFFLKSHIRKPLVFLHIYSFVKKKKDKLTAKIMYFIQKCFNAYLTSSEFSESYP